MSEAWWIPLGRSIAPWADEVSCPAGVVASVGWPGGTVVFSAARNGKSDLMSGIEGKVVAITGASSGIGEATAFRLAERSARLVLGARRTVRLGALAELITAAGDQAVFVATDVTRRGDLAARVDLALERFGQLDVLVNNAGVGPISLLDELAAEDWETMMDVNLKGVLYGIAAALPVFRRQASGHFVNVLSTAGLKIVPLQAVYAGTKNTFVPSLWRLR